MNWIRFGDDAALFGKYQPISITTETDHGTSYRILVIRDHAGLTHEIKTTDTVTEIIDKLNVEVE